MKEGVFYNSLTTEVATGCGKMFIIIVLSEDGTRPIKLLTLAGKTGWCASAHLSSLSVAMDSIFSNINLQDRVVLYTKRLGFHCNQINCCIDTITRHIMEVDMNLEEKEDEESE